MLSVHAFLKSRQTAEPRATGFLIDAFRSLRTKLGGHRPPLQKTRASYTNQLALTKTTAILPRMMQSSRRDFLRGVLTAGAGALLTGGSSRAQNAPAERSIDVHQHFVSPDYHGLLTKKNASSPVPGFNQWKDYSPE